MITERDLFVFVLTLFIVGYLLLNHSWVKSYRYSTRFKRCWMFLFGIPTIVIYVPLFILGRLLSLEFIWETLILKEHPTELDTQEGIDYYRDLYKKTNPYTKLLLRIFDKQTSYKYNLTRYGK